MICYEDILAGYLRQVGELHPNLIVNMTVDSWYGARTEPWEHLALAVFATVELRAAMVRSVNSGVSALIDPNGRLLQKTYANDPYREPRRGGRHLGERAAHVGGPYGVREVRQLVCLSVHRGHAPHGLERDQTAPRRRLRPFSMLGQVCTVRLPEYLVVQPHLRGRRKGAGIVERRGGDVDGGRAL